MMIDKVKEFIEKDNKYKKALKAVYENPYSEKKDLLEASGLTLEELENAIKDLEKELIVLELTSQANSSIESRVPKKIYIVNPDIEEELEDIL